MRKDKKDSLAKIFEALARGGAINHCRNEINSAGLNVRDRPEVGPYVEPVSEHLHTQVMASKLSYDAVTSIPTGGNAWAEALARIATAREGREVPLYRINKDQTRIFSIIDGQPIKPKAKLLVIDDTLYLGRTSSAAVAVLEKAKFKIAGLVFPVEIGLQGREHWNKLRYPVFSIFNTPFVQALG